MRLLVIEDNASVARAIEDGLARHGFNVDISHTSHDGETLAAIEPYQVIILDLMLPDGDGLRLCRSLRQRGVNTPVLIVTALGETHEKVIGLNAGADDYLPKPFDFDELLARVRALVRRSGQSSTPRLAYEDLSMDLLQHHVERAGKPVELTRKEFALLEYFLRNPHRLLTRAAIGEHVWDMNFDPFSNVIDVYVSMLRRKVDKPFARSLIHTIIGSGYYFGLRKPTAGSPPDHAD